MADSSLVCQSYENTGGFASHSTKDNTTLDIAETNSQSPFCLETGAYFMQSVRNSYRKRGFSKNATNIIMSSWRSSTKREYQVHISKWIQFCSRRKIDSISVSVQDVIEFLTNEYEKGLSYSSINTSRAALSSLGIMLDNFTAGTHPIVIRFMKGVFNSRPTKPRYPYTWDVDKVLNYLKTLSPVRQLSLKDLTLKLRMLIVLTNAARVQSVHMLT